MNCALIENSVKHTLKQRSADFWHEHATILFAVVDFDITDYLFFTFLFSLFRHTINYTISNILNKNRKFMYNNKYGPLTIRAWSQVSWLRVHNFAKIAECKLVFWHWLAYSRVVSIFNRIFVLNIQAMCSNRTRWPWATVCRCSRSIHSTAGTVQNTSRVTRFSPSFYGKLFVPKQDARDDKNLIISSIIHVCMVESWLIHLWKHD